MKIAHLATALILLPSCALAHLGNQGIDGLSSGLLHPLTGIDHLAVMVAVGILATMQGGRALWQFPLTFVGMMVAGALMAGAGLPLVAVEPAIVLSSIVLGTMILLGLQLRTGASLVIIGGFAMFHGHAHGTEVAFGASWTAFITGFVLSTAALHLAGIACAAAAREKATTFRYSAGLIIASVGVLTGVGAI